MSKNRLFLTVLVCCLMCVFSFPSYADEIQKCGTRYIYTGGGQECEMQRLEVLLADLSEVERVIAIAGLEKETSDDLRTQSLLAIKRGDTTALAEIYYQVAKTRATETEYRQYNGREFKIELIYYKGINTGWNKIAENAAAHEVASKLSEGIVDYTDNQLKLPLVSGALTLLDLYESVTGSRPIEGNYKDYIQVRVVYDIYNKHTYIQSQGVQPSWMHGAYTRKVNLKEIGTSQYYFGYYGGNTVDTNYAVNMSLQTPHYEDAVPTVYQRAQSNLEMNQLTEDIVIKINNQKLIL